MKNTGAISMGGRLGAVATRNSIFLVTLAVLAGLGLAALPSLQAREMTPGEMIEQGLPPGKNMQNATKSEFLFAVCAAVKKHRRDAPQIARTAVLAHKEYAGDIVETIVRCAFPTEQIDCEFVAAIVAAAVAAVPDATAAIADGALAAAPNCADAIQAASAQVPSEGPGFEGGTAPTGALPPPGSIGGGGGGFNPQEQPILVCDNGTERQVAPSQLAAFLSSHPGAFVGPCQPTPTTNK